MSGCGCEVEIKNREQSRMLILLLAINGVMFVAEVIAGVIGDSTALIADSLDMLADASVYAIALYAVGKSLLIKAKAAHLSGIFQVVLGLGVLVAWLGSPWPDLIIGLVIAVIVVRGGLHIIKDATTENLSDSDKETSS